MDDLSTYWIEIIGLKNQQYQFNYNISDSFFKIFEESEIKKGSLRCFLSLIKTDNYITIDFKIDGTVNLVCDRSLDEFDFPVNISNTMMFKYGEEDREIDDEVEIISRTRQGINVAQYIYEYIATFIPMKRLHPRYRKEMDEGQGDKLIYSSSTDETEDNDSKDDVKDVDPRWEELLKIRKQFN